MSNKQQYDRVHHLAKTIVCCIVVLLLILGRYTGFLVLDIAAVVVWFFGVNAVAYLIESALHIKHRHSKF